MNDTVSISVARKRIVLNRPMELLSVAEQEQVWQLSRDHDVYIRDVNGLLWTVLDLTVDELDTVLLTARLGSVVSVLREDARKESSDDPTKT